MTICFNLAFAQDHRFIDSLKGVLESAKADTTRVNMLNALAANSWYASVEEASGYADQAEALAKKIGFREGLGTAYYCKGVVQYFQTNYSEALKYYGLSREIKRELGDLREVANSYITASLIYTFQGDYLGALEHLFEAVEINHGEDYQLGLASCYDNIGTVYYYQDDWNQSLEFYEKAAAIYEKENVAYKMGGTCNNIGNVCEKLKDYPKASKYYKKSLKIQREVGNKKGEAITMSAFGNIHLMTGNPDSALTYYNEALALQEEIGDDWGAIYTLSSSGNAHVNKGNFPLAITIFERCVAMARSINERSILLEVYEYLAFANDSVGNYAKALEAIKSYASIKDSLFNEDKSKEIGKLEAKHEFETAEHERLRAEEEIIKQLALAERRRNNLQYSGILIFIVLVFASVFALGRVSIPIRLAEGLIFFSFLLFFEFTLVLLDPYIEHYSSGGPAIKLGFNAILAALIFPLHSVFESKLKGKLVR